MRSYLIAMTNQVLIKAEIVEVKGTIFTNLKEIHIFHYQRSDYIVKNILKKT